ncbi:hypothetical protein PG985_014637 [Apiospora marii]|uniref:uncharacterized protein n=1 Tax=Apiospora marii TaxID=335849 RepID=UPI00312F6A88
MASGRHSFEEVEYLGERPAKRTRMSAQAQAVLDADLQSLRDAEAKILLIQFAPRLPALAQGVRDHCVSRRLRESQLIREYDSQVQRAVTLVNSERTPDGRWGNSRILAWVQQEIESMLKQIVDEIEPYSSYQSKFNAVEGMLEIFEAVMYQRSEPCHDLITNRRRWDNLFHDVFACFHDGELTTLARHHRRHGSFNGDYEDPGWLVRLQKFVEEAQRFRFVPGVKDAYQTLCDRCGV